jgi:hypothetical protein
MTAFFLEKCPAKIAAKTLRCDLAACMFCRPTTFQSRARGALQQWSFTNKLYFTYLQIMLQDPFLYTVSQHCAMRSLPLMSK